MYFHIFKNNSSQQTVLTNYVTHEINVNSYQCSAKSSCSNFTALSIIMISTFSSDTSSVKILTYELFHVKQEQESSIMKSVKTLANEDVTSEFSKRFRMKNASNFLTSLFQTQIQTNSDAQYQISNNYSKKKSIKYIEKKVNFISLMNMLDKTSDQINKIILIRQILKFNRVNLT